MKKIYMLLFCSSLLSGLTASSQIRKGSILLGGDIGGSLRNTTIDGVDVGDDNGLRISPVFGKAIKDNLFLGADATVDIYKSEFYNSPYDYKRHGYGGGFFIRKYKSLGKGDFFLFMQGRLGYSYNLNQSINQSPSNYKTMYHAIEFAVYPGISYAVNKKLHLETGFNRLLALNYLNEKREETTGNVIKVIKSNGVSVSSSLTNFSQFYVGFRLLLSK